MVFYATSGGVVFDEPFSEEGRQCAHDKTEARERLAKKLANRRGKAHSRLEQQQQQDVVDTVAPIVNSDAATTTVVTTVHNEQTEAAAAAAELEQLRLLETRLRSAHLDLESVHEQNMNNKFLAREAMLNKRGESKAIPSNYVYQPSPADNATKRAIVHHTSSHYHMAGSRQFQRGVRVKGVVSRHSKQGAKLQAARMAARNMMAAREDARGERSAGSKSLGKTTKKKNKNQAEG